MPGNEHGDRVHNFFAQDNSSHGQHRSHVGNQSMLNNNFWVGSQRQIDVPNSSSINYSSQNSETDTLQASYPVHATHSFNFSQSNLRPDFSKSGSINEHQLSNGFMYGNQFHQTRQNEANFLAVDTDSDQRHLIASRSQPVYELQQPGWEERQTKTSDKPETSGPPVGFDLFGGQQQMSHQQASMLQALQRRQSGFSDMQQLQQQQLMIRKMQELQNQQQLWQLDAMPQHLSNQVPPFSKEASSSQSSTLINGTRNSEALQYPWTAEPSKNWLSRSSSAMQASPGRLAFSADVGRTQHLVDVVPQHVDQSLYGVPVSSSRGLAVNQYSPMVTERSSSMEQMANSSNSSLRIQHNFLPDQIGGHEETSISRQKFQNLNIGHVSSQSLNTRIMDIGGLQQSNSMQRSAPQHEFRGRQEQAAQSETSYEISTRQVSEPGNEVPLDPAEEKILYGSDDNIWSAFSKSTNMSVETANLFDNGGSPDGFLQIGSWSALMQSAVAETSNSDIRAHEEWSGVNFHKPEGSSANQAHSMHNDNVKQASIPTENIQISSALISGSNPPSDNVNTMGSNRLGHKFQNESYQRTPTDTSQRFGQSLEETREWSNRMPLQKSVVEAIQIYGNASEQSLSAERNPKTNATTSALDQSGTGQPLDGWNAMATVPRGTDRLFNVQGAEKLSQNSPNNQVRVMERDGGHRNSLWKSNSVTGSASATELSRVQSTVGNHQESKGALSLNDANASVANSYNKGVADRTNAFVQSKDLFSQWKNGYPSANVHGAEGLGRILDQASEYNNGLNLLNSSKKDEVTRHDMQNCATKENSNDSHQSNLSQHASGGFRESGLLDANDSRSLPLGKQRTNDQLTSKVPHHRKFQYHPMGNLGEHVEPANGTKQPTQVKATSLQKQSKLFGQLSRNSRGTEKDELPKDPEPEPSCDNWPGSAPNMSVPLSRTLDSCINRDSSPSQNMLELLHKVDQSRDHDSLMHLSSGRNLSSHLPEAEKFDVSGGRLQRSQSSVPQGFGLQLGPPSEKGLVMVQTSSVQSLPPNEESPIEFENDRSAGPGHPGNGNSLYKVPGNYHPAFSSGTPYARNQLQNKITRLSGEVSTNQHIDSLSCNTSHSMRGGSTESLLPDACHNIKKDNFVPSGGTVQERDPYDVQEIVRPAATLTRKEMHSSQHFGMPSISRAGASGQVLHNMWASVSSHQHTLAAQHQAPPSQFPGPPQPNILESNTQGNLNFGKGGHHSSEVHANSPAVFDGKEPKLKESSEQFASFAPAVFDGKEPKSKETSVPFASFAPVPEMEEGPGKTSSIKNHLDDCPANSTSKLKDIEAFGQSLKSDAVTNKKHALLNQMRTWKDSETDPCIRVSKRVRVLDNDLSVRQVHLMAGPQNEDNVGDSRASSTGNPSQDSSMVGFSTPADILQRNTSPSINAASQDIVISGVDASLGSRSTDFTTSVEHNLVSPQIAPFRFNHYGSIKDGQMVPMCSERKSTSLRPEDAPYPLEKSSSVLGSCNLEENSTGVAIDACQGGRTLVNSAAKSETNEHPSSKSLQLNVADQHQVNLGPKKRQRATSELYSWHKEISEGSQNLSVLSVAEAAWNKTVKSLTEKVEDDADLIDDGPPALRSKRRLVLTTQLMQQVFHPPPGTILSADACFEYDSATYAVSRVTLRDACGAVSCSSDVSLSHDGTDLHSIKGRLNGDPSFTKVIEELLGKARKLENDFSRLDNSASILDLRLECQDLEKFSIINRFARYHGRGQTDISETSTTRKPSAQRYVYSFPPPRNFPDSVQCLSL